MHFFDHAEGSIQHAGLPGWAGNSFQDAGEHGASRKMNLFTDPSLAIEHIQLGSPNPDPHAIGRTSQFHSTRILDRPKIALMATDC